MKVEISKEEYELLLKLKDDANEMFALLRGVPNSSVESWCKRARPTLESLDKFYPVPESEEAEDEECLCEESECGICNDCGAEVDWVTRRYGHED